MSGLTKRELLAGIAGLAGGALLASCSKLDALNGLNRLTPGDGHVARVVEGAAFGSDPARSSMSTHRPGGRSLPTTAVPRSAKLLTRC